VGEVGGRGEIFPSTIFFEKALHKLEGFVNFPPNNELSAKTWSINLKHQTKIVKIYP
jgi:hypothetical protein